MHWHLALISLTAKCTGPPRYVYGIHCSVAPRTPGSYDTMISMIRIYDKRCLKNRPWEYDNICHWLSKGANSFDVIYTLPAKIWNIWKAQCQHLYQTFWFAGNGLAPASNKYCDFKATVMCSVMYIKSNFQLKIHKIMCRSVSIFNTSLKYPRTSRISIITLWIYGNFVCVH